MFCNNLHFIFNSIYVQGGLGHTHFTSDQSHFGASTLSEQNLPKFVISV